MAHAVRQKGSMSTGSLHRCVPLMTATCFQPERHLSMPWQPQAGLAAWGRTHRSLVLTEQLCLCIVHTRAEWMCHMNAAHCSIEA